MALSRDGPSLLARRGANYFCLLPDAAENPVQRHWVATIIDGNRRRFLGQAVVARPWMRPGRYRPDGLSPPA